MQFLAKSLMGKLVSLFLLIALIPVGIVGYLSYQSAKSSLQDATLRELAALRDRAREHVDSLVRQALGDIEYQGATPAVHNAFSYIWAYFDFAIKQDYAKDHPDAPLDFAAEDLQRIIRDIDPTFTRFLEKFRKQRGYEDVLLILGDETGVVVYTARKLPDMGKSLSSGSLANSSLARLWKTVRASMKPSAVDLAQYQPSGTASWFIGVPVVFSEKHKLIGVLALRLAPVSMLDVESASRQKADVAHVVLVGKDGTLRAATGRAGEEVLVTKIESIPASEVILGKSGVGEFTDKAGILRLYAWAPVGLNSLNGLNADFDWGIVTGIDSSTAFRQVAALGTRVTITWLIIGILAAVAAFFMARAISLPIRLIADSASRISSGDLTVEVPQIKRSDEVGSLAEAFRTMVKNVRSQIGMVLEAANVLMASTTEITATVTEVAASTSRTASAVTETTATVEQVRQAAKISSERAKQVAVSSREAVRSSESGKNATEETMARMQLIKQQMESIGETVVRLSEQSQAIEDIISAVQDLADQSNLLAVNASIEAARAGDQGKGFAVVAQEIKSLADQSRGATNQVRSILEDTRKWVSAVVMAAEQGGKAVESCVQQSRVAGDAIVTLTQSVTSSAQAASVIDTSSEQQVVGVDQVSQAMSNIEESMKQNLEGARQLEAAAHRLEELGANLKKLIETYRV